jgi:hypothetical protein
MRLDAQHAPFTAPKAAAKVFEIIPKGPSALLLFILDLMVQGTSSQPKAILVPPRPMEIAMFFAEKDVSAVRSCWCPVLISQMEHPFENINGMMVRTRMFNLNNKFITEFFISHLPVFLE